MNSPEIQKPDGVTAAILVGICSTAFLEYAFRADADRIEIGFNADGTWSYVSHAMLTVRGQPEPSRHRDRNTLTKIAKPTPNPLIQMRKR